MTDSSRLVWKPARRMGVTNVVAAIAFVVVIVVAGATGALLGSMSSKSSGTGTTSNTSSSSSQIVSTTSSTNTTISHGSVVVVPANYNFTVGAQSCKYFYFNDESYYANFTGSFNANPEAALYLLNITSYSLAQASGSSIVSFTFATTGNDNQTYVNHLMVTGYKFNVAIPFNQYYAGFCDWTNNPTVVSTNSTGIDAAW